MIILSERSEEVVYVEVLFVDGYGAIRHFGTVIVAHKFVERIETRDNIAVFRHLVEEHRQCRTEFSALSLGNSLVLRFPQSQEQRLYGIAFLHIEDAVICEKRVE